MKINKQNIYTMHIYMCSLTKSVFLRRCAFVSLLFKRVKKMKNQLEDVKLY